MAGFETSLYDEDLKGSRRFRSCGCLRYQQGRRRRRNQRKSLLCAHRIAGIARTASDSRWLRRHKLAARRAESRAAESQSIIPVLTVVPGFVRYPPELAYPAASAHQRTSSGSARIRVEPHGVVPW